LVFRLHSEPIAQAIFATPVRKVIFSIQLHRLFLI
jgi:hypothetical protein